MSRPHNSGTDRTGMAVRNARLARLLAQAARLHPGDAWVRRALELVPNLDAYLPCTGQFGETSCCEFHQHGLRCGDPADICKLCGRTNAEHRTAWAELE